MKKRQKAYNPNSKYNPAYVARKLEKLAGEIEVSKQNIHAISFSHDNHISRLANFAKHDIKNAIQNMDSILSTTSGSDFDDKSIHSLVTSLDAIRTTMDNFAKLVPFSTTGTFSLDDLMVAVEVLARAEMQKNDIEMIFEYPRNTISSIDLPFQIVLQMMINLIINSFKSLESVACKKMLIRVTRSEEKLLIEIKDNGCIIEKGNADKIFEYGYSTTGGSGIGLFHARYLCSEFNGSIALDLESDSMYTKSFIVKLPLTAHPHGKDSINH